MGGEPVCKVDPAGPAARSNGGNGGFPDCGAGFAGKGRLSLTFSWFGTRPEALLPAPEGLVLPSSVHLRDHGGGVRSILSTRLVAANDGHAGLHDRVSPAADPLTQ